MIREYLKEHILITDGAMGTYYGIFSLSEKRLCLIGEALFPAYNQDDEKTSRQDDSCRRQKGWEGHDIISFAHICGVELLYTISAGKQAAAKQTFVFT